MDIYEIRKHNLIKLIGSQRKAACAERWSMSPAHLSQILSEKTSKNLGDEVARRIEVSEKLPRGWIDSIHDAAGSISLGEPASEDEGPRPHYKNELYEQAAPELQKAIDDFVIGVLGLPTDRALKVTRAMNTLVPADDGKKR